MLAPPQRRRAGVGVLAAVRKSDRPVGYRAPGQTGPGVGGPALNQISPPCLTGFRRCRSGITCRHQHRAPLPKGTYCRMDE